MNRTSRDWSPEFALLPSAGSAKNSDLRGKSRPVIWAVGAISVLMLTCLPQVVDACWLSEEIALNAQLAAGGSASIILVEKQECITTADGGISTVVTFSFVNENGLVLLSNQTLAFEGGRVGADVYLVSTSPRLLTGQYYFSVLTSTDTGWRFLAGQMSALDIMPDDPVVSPSSVVMLKEEHAFCEPGSTEPLKAVALQALLEGLDVDPATIATSGEGGQE